MADNFEAVEIMADFVHENNHNSALFNITSCKVKITSIVDEGIYNDKQHKYSDF